MTQILRYGNDGKSLGPLPFDDAVHDEDLDGSDKLTVRCSRALKKRDRLVWADNAGEWHEHMVDSVERSRSGGKAMSEATCSNSISELYGVIATGTVLKGDVSVILAALLEGTRWDAGPCSWFRKVKLEVWHKDVRQCIRELCEACGGELVTVIKVNAFGVRSRTASIVRRRGGKGVMRQLTYGRNMARVTREVGDDEVYTKVVGYGAKAEEITLRARYEELSNKDTSNMSDAEKERLQKERDSLQAQIKSVQANDYAARVTAEAVDPDIDLERWGVPNGDGTFGHNVMVYTDAGCTDQAFLAKMCKRMLDANSEPSVTYTIEAVQSEGDDWADMTLGSKVMCVDPMLPRGEVTRRVSHIRRRLSGRMTCQIVVGTRSNPLVKQFKAVEKAAREKSGNKAKVYADTPSFTAGGKSFTMPGFSTTNPNEVGGYDSSMVSGSGGDGITHTLDGVIISGGTIAFSTAVAGPSSPQDETPYDAVVQMGQGTVQDTGDATSNALWGGLGGS